MHFKTLILSLLFLLLSTSCGNSPEQFTIIEGTIVDELGNPITSGTLEVQIYTIVLFGAGATQTTVDEINIQSDGTFSYAFFNESILSLTLIKKDDFISSCISRELIDFGARNTFALSTKRKKPLLLLRAKHEVGMMPDSFEMIISYKEGLCIHNTTNQFHPFEKNIISDTLTEYLYNFIENDSLRVSFRPYVQGAEGTYQRSDVRISPDTSVIELEF